MYIWPIQSDFYGNFDKIFDETDEIQNKPVETSEYEPNNSPILNLQELFSRENRQEGNSLKPKPLVRNLAGSLYAGSKNFRPKSNPLCFFSALPCKPRRKDAYYVPRKYSSQL
uniref:Uncharacterized protein n=1 Tax=Acrobeloides nanus TaxID=290746 RepID=A0A914CB75_9BILA